MERILLKMRIVEDQINDKKMFNFTLKSYPD